VGLPQTKRLSNNWLMLGVSVLMAFGFFVLLPFFLVCAVILLAQALLKMVKSSFNFIIDNIALSFIFSLGGVSFGAFFGVSDVIGIWGFVIGCLIDFLRYNASMNELEIIPQVIIDKPKPIVIKPWAWRGFQSGAGPREDSILRDV